MFTLISACVFLFYCQLLLLSGTLLSQIIRAKRRKSLISSFCVYLVFTFWIMSFMLLHMASYSMDQIPTSKRISLMFSISLQLWHAFCIPLISPRNLHSSLNILQSLDLLSFFLTYLSTSNKLNSQVILYFFKLLMKIIILFINFSLNKIE